MTRFFLSLLGVLLLYPAVTKAENFSYDLSGSARALAGWNNPVKPHIPDQRRWNFPTFGTLDGRISYEFSPDVVFSFNSKIKAQTDTALENLNQGHWGEEVSFTLESSLGELWIGQTQSVAQMLTAGHADYSLWQPDEIELTNFLHNPNWRQKGRTKFFNTLSSTRIDTDGTAPKISYISPEFAGTTLGLSYTPKNNANDGLTSKFSPYWNKSVYTAALSTMQTIADFDLDFYLAGAHAESSHNEIAAGASVYHRGWTLFGSYRQSKETSSQNARHQPSGSNTPLGYDGFRNSKAYQFGLGYEIAFYASTVSYFRSYATKNQAENEIYHWHNMCKIGKNIGLYLGLGYARYKTNVKKSENRGAIVYTGAQYSF